jgi:hypothetical protein
MSVVEPIGEEKSEVGAHKDVFGEAAVGGVAGEDWIVAEVLFGATTEGAGTVGATDPGDADPHTDGAFRSGTLDDLADNLVTGNERLVDERKIAFEDVEVSAADPAG